MQKRCDVHYFTPDFRGFIEDLQKLQTVSRIGDLILRWDRGDGPREGFYTDDIEEGVPFLRINNLAEHSVDLSDVKLITREVHENTLKRTKVAPGDLIFAISGTKDNLGTVSIVPETVTEANLNSALIRIELDRLRVTQEFFCFFFDTSIARKQIEYIGKGAAQNNLNNEEISEILVPLPSLETQHALVAQLDAARQERAKRLADADALLTGLDDFLLDELKVKVPDEESLLAFAVPVNQLEGALNPERYAGLFIERAIEGTTIGEVAKIVEEKRTPATEAPDELWDWIRIDDLESRPLDVTQKRTLMGAEIEGSLFAVQEGDILLARLGPTIQNAKFILCPPLERQTVASSEFLVLRCHDDWQPSVVLWMLRTSLFRRLIYSKGRGGTPSRYRVNREDLAKLPFPSPPSHQDEITHEIETRLNRVRSLRADAERDWEAVKARFEAALLG